MKRILIIFTLLSYVICYGQQTDYVDFTKGLAKLKIIPDSGMVTGMVVYKFDVVKSIDSIFIDARNLNIQNVYLNEQQVSFVYKDNKVIIKKPFRPSIDNEIQIQYHANPKKAMYFVRRDEEWNIWTQGQGKYTSHWLPSFDDVNEKIVFSFNYEVPDAYNVVSNGKLISKNVIQSGWNQWVYQMHRAMSSYLVAIAIGDYYYVNETSQSGVPLKYYYYPEDSLKVEPTFRYSKRMFDFLEDEIGFDYPWQNYKQVPVHDFLYAGMENTSCTIFSDAFVVDSIGFNDKNYVNVNAHELAHQWFGDLVTAASGAHHWLQEGFSTYYALLAERDIFGDDYYYFKLYESAIELGRQDMTGKGTSLLNPNSSSLTFYQRGAWVLFALRDKVGDKVFKQAVRNYLKTNAFGSANTSDFISEAERLAGINLNSFVNNWIKSEEFPAYGAIDLLKKKSAFIQEFLMVDCQVKSSKCEDHLKYGVSDEAKIKVISQAPELITKDTFKSSLKVRQAIAQHLTTIPEELKEDYESLLDDKSYITIERALYNLWVNFPLERAKYLSKTRFTDGFSDKNVRLLWIVLNLNTPYYNAESNKELYTELLSYTEDKYNADLRINAFEYLKLINGCDAICKNNLENAKSHHNWRLVKFAKEFSQQLEENKD